MNILILSNMDDDEKLEDIWLARAFLKDGHKVCISGFDYDERLEEIFDVFIKRNIWFSGENERTTSGENIELVNQRIKNKNLPRINFDGGFDANDKTYMVELFKKGYKVVPTIDNLEDINLLQNSEVYLLKPKVGCDGIGQIKVTKEQLKEKFTNNYIMEPFIKFKSEVQFYFINNEFQYALEFKPSKVPIYPVAIKYNYTEKELELAQSFANLNKNFWGIQRIDFLKLENGELKLIEIEDDSPYLDLDCVDIDTRNKFIKNYKEMVYRCLESRRVQNN